MGLGKIELNVGKRLIAWTKASTNGILVTKPIKVNCAELRFNPQLGSDIVEISSKGIKKVDSKVLLARLDEEFPDIEKLFGTNCSEEITYKYYKSMIETNPEAYALLREHLSDYTLGKSVYKNSVSKLIKETSATEMKQCFTELEKLYQKLPPQKIWDGNWKVVGEKFQTPEDAEYLIMLHIKRYNPKLYDYLMREIDPRKTQAIISSWANKSVSTTVFKELTPQQLRVMSNSRCAFDDLETRRQLGAYVDSSDAFAKNADCVNELSLGLSKYKLAEDVELYRSEKGVGMFASVPIDKGLETQVRKLIANNRKAATNMKISSYDGRYLAIPYKNLYDSIMNKETLTLADAMQVARFGDEKYIEKLSQLIKDTKIMDNRFKSLSFSRGFAEGWGYQHRGDNAIILQKATVKQGTQGVYHDGDNDQMEFVLNNITKQITFNDVVYDKAENVFRFNSTIQNV